MTDLPTSQRAGLRRKMLALRNQLPTDKRAELNSRLCERVLALPPFARQRNIFIYCSYLSEVATGALIDQLLVSGHTVCVPLVQPATSTMQAVALSCPETELVPGYRGIPEPRSSLIPDRIFPAERLDITLVPGSVFDRQGYRLGYGGGYYDRFLSLAAPQALRIGLAFSIQLVMRIPLLPHDIPMDVLVTEKEVFSWARDNHSGTDEVLQENCSLPNLTASKKVKI
jgi:5-formyltetrahydrofolate cyclo-ligase